MVVTPFVFVVLALAAYRLTHVLAGADSLLEGTQRKILGWAYELDECGGALLDDCHDMIRRPGVGVVRSKIVDLLTCPFCLGMWVSTSMLCLWVKVWPWSLGWHGWLTALALAAVQSFLTAIDNR